MTTESQHSGREEWLPASHKITERGPLSGKPFGVGADGQRIAEISGKVVRSVVEMVAEVAGEEAVSRLCERLNELTEDEAYHVDPRFLRNEWHAYSYEYYHYILEVAKVVADDDDLLYKRGPKTVPAALAAILRPLSLGQIYQLVPRLATRFVAYADLEVVRIEDSSATIRMRIDPRYEAITGRYTPACQQNACDSYRGTLASIPYVINSHAAWAEVESTKCLVDGDEFCEWVFRWAKPAPRTRRGLLVGAVAATGALTAGLLASTFWVWPLAVAVAAVAAGVAWDRYRHVEFELSHKQDVLQNQSLEFQRQYDELERAYDQLQILRLDLEAQVLSRTKELRSANAQLTRLAITDELTRLANRRHFYDTLEDELERSKRYGHVVSLLMIDVDHFKVYNDTHGHLRGDRALRALGETLSAQTRTMDTVARYGGEEFAVLLPETELDAATQVAEKLRATIDAIDASAQDGSEVAELLGPLTISVGVAATDPATQSLSAEQLVLAADDALYVAKSKGRNRISVAGK